MSKAPDDALVAAVSDHPIEDRSTSPDPLAQSDSDAQRAANLLDSPNKDSEEVEKIEAGAKRKRTISGILDSWVKVPEGSTLKPAVPSTPKKKKTAARGSTFSTPRHKISASARLRKEQTGEDSPSPSKIRKAIPLSQAEFLGKLRPPNFGESPSKPAYMKPLTLASPDMVVKHTPCTMHRTILPPDVAYRLFFEMLDASKKWEGTKWCIGDNVNETTYRTSFYQRNNPSLTPVIGDAQQAAQIWFNGRPTSAPEHFSSVMEEACQYVERVVSEEMRKRDRFPLEWGGSYCAPNGDEEENPSGQVSWRANVATANIFENSSASVSLHSDHLTQIGPYATIARLSLGTTREFRLREEIPVDDIDARAARTYIIHSQHNSLLIMHAGCQETFKHSVPPQGAMDVFRPSFSLHGESSAGPSNTDKSSRSTLPTFNDHISITFRFYRPDFRPSLIEKCKCNFPYTLRPDMKRRHALPPPDFAAEEGAHQPPPRKEMVERYWWKCNAGAENQAKTCRPWKIMDVKGEGRGPFAGGPDTTSILPPPDPRASI